MPEEATFSGMPRSALRLVDVDYCVRLSDMATLLRELVADKDVPTEVR